MQVIINTMRSYSGKNGDKWKAVVCIGANEVFRSDWYDACYDAMSEAINHYEANYRRVKK